MMSLNRADALRRELEEEHGFNAEQANGTLMVVDEMVENGFDRMAKDIESLLSDMAKDIESLRSVMDERFKASNRLFMILQALLPFANAVITIGLLAALASIFGDSTNSTIWLD